MGYLLFFLMTFLYIFANYQKEHTFLSVVKGWPYQLLASFLGGTLGYVIFRFVLDFTIKESFAFGVIVALGAATIVAFEYKGRNK